MLVTAHTRTSTVYTSTCRILILAPLSAMYVAAPPQVNWGNCHCSSSETCDHNPLIKWVGSEKEKIDKYDIQTAHYNICVVCQCSSKLIEMKTG